MKTSIPFILAFLFTSLLAPAQQRKMPKIPNKPPAPSAPSPYSRKVAGPYVWTSSFQPIFGSFEPWPSGLEYSLTIAGVLDLNTPSVQQGPITITSVAVVSKHNTEMDYCPAGGTCRPVGCPTPAHWEISANDGVTSTSLVTYPVTNQAGIDQEAYAGSDASSTRYNISVPAGRYLIAGYWLGSGEDGAHPCRNYGSQLMVQYTVP
jgi:hypothetical protein